MKYTAGYSRSRVHPTRDDLDFGPSDVECPVCGGLDNHCANRRGLCCWCFCSLLNSLGGSNAEQMAAFRAMSFDDMTARAKSARKAAIRRGTARKTKAMRDAEAESMKNAARECELQVKNNSVDVKTAEAAKRNMAARLRKAEKCRKYRIAHPDRTKEAKRRWREEQKAKRRAMLAEKYGVGYKSQSNAQQHKPAGKSKPVASAGDQKPADELRREKEREKQRRWRMANPAKYRAIKHRWYLRHREEEQARQRAYYAAKTAAATGKEEP